MVPLDLHVSFGFWLPARVTSLVALRGGQALELQLEHDSDVRRVRNLEDASANLAGAVGLSIPAVREERAGADPAGPARLAGAAHGPEPAQGKPARAVLGRILGRQ